MEIDRRRPEIAWKTLSNQLQILDLWRKTSTSQTRDLLTHHYPFCHFQWGIFFSRHCQEEYDSIQCKMCSMENSVGLQILCWISLSKERAMEDHNFYLHPRLLSMFAGQTFALHFCPFYLFYLVMVWFYFLDKKSSNFRPEADTHTNKKKIFFMEEERSVSVSGQHYDRYQINYIQQHQTFRGFWPKMK